MKILSLYSSLNLLFILASNCLFAGIAENRELMKQYNWHCSHTSDINEHIPILRSLAKQCSTVTEIGVRSMNSTWGILLGLAENRKNNSSYVGIDLNQPPKQIIDLATKLARGNGIAFQFKQANDMQIDIEETDLLFIDSLHTYCHLTYELEKFAPKTRMFIAMHDTDKPWGFIDDNLYYGDKSEYPPEISREKSGLWMAVEDFLQNHPEWTLFQHRKNNHGFTILKRVS